MGSRFPSGVMGPPMGDYTLPQAVGQGKDNQSPLVAREAKSFCEPFPISPTLRGPNKHTSLGRNLHSRIDKANMSYKENEKNTWNINFATLIFVFRLWVSEACLLFSPTPWPGQTITCRPHTRSRIGALCPEDFTMRCPRGAALQNLKTYPHRLLLRSFSGLWGWPRPEGRAGSVKLKNPNFRMPKCSPPRGANSKPLRNTQKRAETRAKRVDRWPRCDGAISRVWAQLMSHLFPCTSRVVGLSSR